MFGFDDLLIHAYKVNESHATHTHTHSKNELDVLRSSRLNSTCPRVIMLSNGHYRLVAVSCAATQRLRSLGSVAFYKCTSLMVKIAARTAQYTLSKISAVFGVPFFVAAPFSLFVFRWCRL